MAQSKLQQLASKENYALFQLNGMTGNINALLRVGYLERKYILALEHAIIDIRGQIKQAQYKRQKARDETHS